MTRVAFIRTTLLAAAIGGLSTISGGARADDNRTFLMPENDGYGIGDCLAAGAKSACGKVVADAWCESKGFARAKSFGRGDPSDITGSVPVGNSKTSQPPALVIITCDG